MPLSKPLDNGIENAVRPVAVGRKNYLFCQNDDTAESTAIIYSVMGCCKAARRRLPQMDDLLLRPCA